MLVLGTAVPGVLRARAARQRHEAFKLFGGPCAVEVPRVAARNLENARPTVGLPRDAAVLAKLGDVADVVRRGRVV